MKILGYETQITKRLLYNIGIGRAKYVAYTPTGVGRSAPPSWIVKPGIIIDTSEEVAEILLQNVIK